MRDRQRRQELEGLHTLGDLAGEMVVALGTAMGTTNLSPAERRVLAKAHELFELMSSDDVIAVGAAAGRMLGGERSYIDAVRAVEREANGSGIEEQAHAYAQTLGKLLDEELNEPERRAIQPDVLALRNFFIHMSENVLSRAEALSRTREELPWRSVQQPTSTS